MLLIEKVGIPQETLTETAKWYGLETTVSRMYRLIEGDHDVDDDAPIRLPSAEEYSALADQYGVS